MQSSRAANFPFAGAGSNAGKGGGLSALVPVLLLLGGGLIVARDSQNGVRLVFAIGAFLLLSGLAWRANPMAASATLIFLAVLGGVRRFLILDFGWAAMDPLVLVGPILSILSFTSMVVNRQVKRDTPLSGTIYWLLIVMVVQIFNPRQHGGLMVGIGGVLFYIAPLAWFYLGKRISTPFNISTLFRVTQGLAVAGALYGYKQFFFGFSEAETVWLKTAGYVSLYISAEAVRVFSFYTSMQEYALFLSVGIVLAFGQLMRRNVVALIPFVIQIPALFLTGGRGPIVLTTLACSVMWAIQSPKRSVWLPRLVTALVLGFAGLAWSLSNADTSTLSAGTAGVLNHQKQILDPTNSTATKHADLVSGGIMAGIKNPIGYGLGSTTSAAMKFGGEGMGSEMDISNLFISLGIVGGVLYAVVMYRVFMQCSALWRATGDYHYQLFIGMLVVLIGQWLNGNLYAICFLVWFTIGYVDKQYAELDRIKKQGSHRRVPTIAHSSHATAFSPQTDPRQIQSHSRTRSAPGFGGRKRKVKLRH